MIIMDVTLAGELNGIEAAQQIKADYNIPIIIFSGYENTLLREQASQINPVAIVSKLTSFTDLTDAIDKAAKETIKN